ncbi:response regulator [Paenibacillaceae bacterium]|nr:response regulator [Paenibacillaceae bacterium]
MYKILIVDDEMLICLGLKNLLSKAGLPIEEIFTAHNGHEALDYLRMEDIDLLITDIQMDGMNGIELMQQAKIMKTDVQIMVISAFEDFHYAQLAIRFGAKDYLVKPLNGEQFLDTVRNLLLTMAKPLPTEEEVQLELQDHFVMKEPEPGSIRLLNTLLSGGETYGGNNDILEQLLREHQIRLEGPYYCVFKVKLKLAGDGGTLPKVRTEQDVNLLHYAALNIIYESLESGWRHVSFYSPDDGLTVIIQWTEEAYSESHINIIGQLEMVGKLLSLNIHQYLKMDCLVGISQVLQGPEFLADLSGQALKALRWNKEHHENRVFYYGDLNWNAMYDEDPSASEFHDQVHQIVNKAKDYIHQHYSQKGLTLSSVAAKNHVSPNYLSYLFKKYTGFSLWGYVIKLRMEESKRLLLETDLRRYEIAEQVGYESPEHFSKIFKKYYGKSLSEMKK